VLARYKTLIPWLKVKVISTFQCTPELQGLAAMVHARRAQYRTQFVQLQPRLLAINDTFFSRAMFSFDNFVWSQSILRSRCWSKNEASVLLPVMDLFNHGHRTNFVAFDGTWLKLSPNVTRPTENNSTASLKAHKEYLPGDEVHDGYATSNCNLIWLLNYGFTMSGSDCYCDLTASSPHARVAENLQSLTRQPGYCNERGHFERAINIGLGDESFSHSGAYMFVE